MLPKLIYSQSDSSLQQYIESFIEKHSINNNYIYHIRAEKTELGIEQIREMKKETITSSGSMKLFILYGFETASAEAQNALLKTLEEMQEKNIFMMLTHNKERVLPTIHSRVELIDLDIHNTAFVLRDEVVKLWETDLRAGSFAIFESPIVNGVTKEQAVTLFDELIILMKKEMVTQRSYVSHIKYGLLKKDLLISNNLNPQLALDSFLLHIISGRNRVIS